METDQNITLHYITLHYKTLIKNLIKDQATYRSYRMEGRRDGGE